MLSIKVIIICLIIELFFVKLYTNTRWLKACMATLAMNIASCLLGFVLIPISSLVAEVLPFNTFHWTHWLASYIFAIAINAIIESFIIKLLLKLKIKSVFKWLFVANTISILTCILFFGIELGIKM